MIFRLLLVPGEHHLKNMGDEIHQINGIIPTYHQIPGLAGFTWFGLVLNLDSWQDKRLFDSSHCQKINIFCHSVERGPAKCTRALENRRSPVMFRYERLRVAKCVSENLRPSGLY